LHILFEQVWPVIDIFSQLPGRFLNKIRLSILKIVWLLVRLSIFLGNNDVYVGYKITG
jgi:hypothetical protein